LNAFTGESIQTDNALRRQKTGTRENSYNCFEHKSHDCHNWS